MDERKVFVKSGINLISITTALILLFVATFVHATARVEYYHTDTLGSVIASTDEGGNVLWRESYRPFGDRMLKQVSTQENTPFYTGKPHDDATGLSYFGARYYDPNLGRFLGVDPAGVDPTNLHSFNRYAYANNNPYKNVDPDGKFPLLAIAFIAYDFYSSYQETGSFKEAAISTAVGMINPFKKIKTVAKIVNKIRKATKGAGTETVQRWMSKAELKATQETGLLRGGRGGTHYVTDAANSSAKRARQRLALDRTPEVRVTMDVPKGKFGPSSRVNQKYNMPGGGTERIATGNIPVKIKKVDW